MYINSFFIHSILIEYQVLKGLDYHQSGSGYLRNQFGIVGITSQSIYHNHFYIPESLRSRLNSITN